ncbi:MAG: flagellar motor protein MotB [Actinomycetia bacterium]|nr:flagellar motor protein MotB [Actinomycetes bacterium]MCP3911083.1 flagellar motor protein MotB [Actinomycetes bacterium]
MAKKKVEEDEGPSKAWLDSFADAMTLLLAFFIMLFAFAIVDQSKFDEFKTGVKASFVHTAVTLEQSSGIMGEGDTLANATGYAAQLNAQPTQYDGDTEELLEELEKAGEVTEAEREALEEVLRRQFEQAGVGDLVEVGRDPRGVVLRFEEEILFESGEAELRPDGVEAIGIAASVLDLIDNLVVVEGHTDSIPTGSAWPSNWELSAYRATSVVRLMSEGFGLTGARLTAAGHADTRPRAENSTDEGRRRNRRVEVTVLITPPDGMVIDPLTGEVTSLPDSVLTGTDADADISPDDPEVAAEPPGQSSDPELLQGLFPAPPPSEDE